MRCCLNTIAKHFHFVFGLKPQTEPLHIVYYLALQSCIEVNQPDKISFYYHYEPHGEWWDKIKPELHLVPVDLEEFVLGNSSYSSHEEGRFIEAMQLNYAHQADFIRLRVLLEHGGVYADMDTLFLRPMPNSFYQHEFVIGTEGMAPPDDGQPRASLCNALMLAQPGARFVSQWLENMYNVFDGSWNRHSCAEASALGVKHPEQVTVMPRECFYKHGFTAQGIDTLFTSLDNDFKGMYSMHLWNHLWWDKDRVDFSTFHAGMLTENYIRNVDTTYNVIARTFL